MNVIMYYSPLKKIAPFNVIYGSILVFVRFIQMCKLLVRYFKKNSTKGIHFYFLFCLCYVKEEWWSWPIRLFILISVRRSAVYGDKGKHSNFKVDICVSIL